MAKVSITNPIQLADGCKSELLAFKWIDWVVSLGQVLLLKVCWSWRGLEAQYVMRCRASSLFCEWGGQRRFTLSLNINCNIEELAFPVPRRPSTYMESLSFYMQWVPEPATAGGIWRKWQDLNLLGALEYIQVKGIMSPSSHSSYAQKLGVLLLACILTHPFATFCYSFQIQQHILDNHSRMPQPKLNP